MQSSRCYPIQVAQMSIYQQVLKETVHFAITCVLQIQVPVKLGSAASSHENHKHLAVVNLLFFYFNDLVAFSQ